MISTNAYYHTFFVKFAQYGTAFTLDVKGCEYLVTARHLVDASVDDVRLQIFFANKWLTGNAAVVGRGRGDVDVVVLRLPHRLTSPEFKFTATVGDFFLGQDVYFMGFPFKMWGDANGLFDGRPCAFVKKGTISFVSMGNVREFFIEAFNNEGFSGGPVFHYPLNDPNDIRVLAVVSKYRIEYEAVLDSHSKPTGAKVPYNTGFLVAYGIKHVLSIIQGDV